MKFRPLIFLALLLAACSGGKKNTPDPISSGQNIVVAGDSVQLPGFEIEVALDAAATSRLQNAHETIIVQAYFSGIPKDSTQPGLNEMDMLDLGSPRREIMGPGVARFEKVILSRVQYESLLDKDFEVLINVYSGRRSSEFNLLSVDVLQEPLSKAQAGRSVLKGNLIEGQ